MANVQQTQQVAQAVIIGKDNNKYANINSSNAYKRTQEVENPQGSIDSNSFLKLFIATLKNQSIDSTTDIKDIMEYTASMTTVETNNENKRALEKVVETLTNSATYSSQYSLLSAINKIVITNLDTLKFDGKNKIDYSIYSQDKLKDATLNILDETGNTISSVALSEYKNSFGIAGKDERGNPLTNEPSGLLSFAWDGKVNGKLQGKGEYSAKINFSSEDGKQKEVSLGTYKVQSVKFKQGEPFLNLGYIDANMNNILELK
jgi:flagellar basal-body rod modification protein FlgD